MCCMHYYFSERNPDFKSSALKVVQEGSSITRVTEDFRNSKRVSKEHLENVGVSSKNTKEIIFKEICKVDSLLAAYEQIKSNPGMMTPGTSRATLKNISKSWFIDTSKRLMQHNYDFGIRKRVEFSKFNSNEKRSLIVFNPRNMIIELSILNRLEPLLEGVWEWEKITEEEYLRLSKLSSKNKVKKNKEGFFKKNWIQETIFSNHSFGFRPNRSVHDIIRTIKYWPKNVVWLLDYEISKVCDHVNHKRLKNLLMKYFDSPNTIRLIDTMRKNGILKDLDIFFEKKGVPQGSILSPVLFNVYMNEFDKFMEGVIKDERNLDQGSTRSEVELEYDNLLKEFHPSKARLALKKYGSVEAVKKALTEKKKEYYKKHIRLKGARLEARNVLYARYADDFLIGIVGSKEFASKIRNKVNGFLKGNLHLLIKKDVIVNRNDPSILFLGFLVGLPQIKKKKRIISAQREAMLRYKRRVIARASSVDVRIGKSFIFVLQRAIGEASLNMLKPGEVIVKKSLPVLGQRVIENSDIARLSSSANKGLLLAVRHAKQQVNKTNFLSVLQLRETIEALPIPKQMLNNVLIGPRILSHIEQFKLGLDKIQEEFDASVYIKKRASFLESQSPVLVDKALSEGSQSLLQVQWKGITEEETKRLADAKFSCGVSRLISIRAPIKDIVDKLRIKGYFHPKKSRYCSNIALGYLKDYEIVQCYSQIIFSLLGYYALADNISSIRGLATQLKLGCVHTLAYKHKKGKHWVYIEYGRDCEVIGGLDKRIVKLPSDLYISSSSTKRNVVHVRSWNINIDYLSWLSSFSGV